MQLLTLTQLVIGCPPDVDGPEVQVIVDGKECTYTTRTLTKQERQAFIETNEFWLVYTDGLEITSASTAIITLISRNIVVGSISISNIHLGIERYYKKDFFVRRYLPNNIFIDVIVEEGPKSKQKLEKASIPENIAGTVGSKDSAGYISNSRSRDIEKRVIPLDNSRTGDVRNSTGNISDKISQSGNINNSSLCSSNTSNSNDEGHSRSKNNTESSGAEDKNSTLNDRISRNNKGDRKVNIDGTADKSAQNSLPPSNATAAINRTMSGNKPNAAQTDGSVSTPGSDHITAVKSARKLPPPPGMVVRPVVNLLEGVDMLSKTLFPRVGWKPVLSVRGSLYEKTAQPQQDTLEKRWKEIEEDFKRKFCVKRIQNKVEFTKKEKIPKKSRLLNERQEFLLSIVFEAINKKKVSLPEISQELTKWIETGECTPHIEDILNLAGVFPSDKDCANVLSSALSLTATEESLKELLLSNCSKNKLLLIKYAHWADPSLSMLIGTLQNTQSALSVVEQDENFPQFLTLMLRMGNLVNYKYAETASKTETQGFHLSSVSAFSKCFSELANGEGCKLSLMELLIISSRDIVDFDKIVSVYSVFSTFQMKTLRDHYNMIRAGYDEVAALDDFSGKKERLHSILLLIKESKCLISEIDAKIGNLSKIYAVPPESITESMVDAISSIKQYCNLFR
ncbi:hypothetical protein NEMIN01_2374 [Nematocida minor]|uniref:uncharacterized protein n=1 Tax=Nematocida minor TaxID=1912983 RepID=UPI00221FA8D2|nr:uncharacterized protein NEMIN01_2374 [Nematocida minor]KAI5193030.1 hypothetical protein NEMIN01_2374 [Nematocida minor]